MPKLRRLSCRDVVSILSNFGFRLVHQRGSHVKLFRISPDGVRQTLTVPNAREIGPGLLRAILRQASQFVPADELRPHFYHE